MATSSKKELLSKVVWTRGDIKNYFNVSTTQATKIKDRAKNEFDGACPYGEAYVKVDSVLKIFGTTIAEQIEVCKALEGNTNEGV